MLVQNRGSGDHRLHGHHSSATYIQNESMGTDRALHGFKHDKNGSVQLLTNTNTNNMNGDNKYVDADNSGEVNLSPQAHMQLMSPVSANHHALTSERGGGRNCGHSSSMPRLHHLARQGSMLLSPQTAIAAAISQYDDPTISSINKRIVRSSTHSGQNHPQFNSHASHTI